MVVQMGLYEGGVGEDKDLPQCDGLPTIAAQVTVDLGCRLALLGHVGLFVHEGPLVLFHRAAFSELFSQSVLISGVVLTEVQYLSLVLVKPH